MSTIIIRDKKITLTHDFVVNHEYEVVVRAVGPDGTKQALETSARQSIVILGKTDTPSIPTALTATGYLNAVALSWVNPLDYDFDHIEIWRSATNVVTTASKVAEVKGLSYIDTLGGSNLTRYYWVRAINTSDKASDYSPRTTAGVSGTSDGVVATDIADFAVTATKVYNNTIILSSDSWSNNSPGAGSIAWNEHYLTYGGAYYKVTAGNTDKTYVYWDVGNTSGSGTVADPYITTYTASDSYTHADNRFTVATNASGAHQLVWNSSANMVIGSAFILDAAIVEAKIGLLAVTNAKIDTMTASKLTAGTIDASIITVSNLVVGTNVAIGTAEDAAGVTTIVGNTITTGYVNALEITVLGAVTAGSLTGLTVQTAAANQRVVITGGAAGTLEFYDAGGTRVILMDDDMGGYIRVGTGNLQTSIYNGGLNIIGAGGAGVATFQSTNDGADVVRVYGYETGDIAELVFHVDTAGNATFGGPVTAGGNVTFRGNITMLAAKTVDGVDISAMDADDVAETGGKKWAGETGADVTDTANITSNMTDGAHGTRAGGSLHAAATTDTDGFMTDTQYDKLDGIYANADVTGDNNPKSHNNTYHSTNYTSEVTFNAHAGAGGAVHATVKAAGAAGFMTGADKTKLNSVDADADVTGDNAPKAHTHPSTAITDFPSVSAASSGDVLTINEFGEMEWI